MQDSNKWAPPGGVLGELVAAARARVEGISSRRGEIEALATEVPRPPSFLDALGLNTVGVIAEIKRSSPSKGTINPTLDIDQQCAAYKSGGAAAISVLTEPSRFAGSLADLIAAREASTLPLLRKDFIVDGLQIAEARAAGASAVLLIVRALEPSKLRELFRATIENGLYALVEVRNESELEAALSLGATIIGVNNRDLETLAMDDAVQSVLPLIPRNCIAVAESGYRSKEDVLRAASIGADAVLIGSELSASLRPAGLLEELTSISRSRNARPN